MIIVTIYSRPSSGDAACSWISDFIFYIYRVYREDFDTAHRKEGEIEINIKVLYRLAIFAIIIEILIFEIVQMRARREQRSSRSRCSPVQFIKHWLWAVR